MEASGSPASYDASAAFPARFVVYGNPLPSVFQQILSLADAISVRSLWSRNSHGSCEGITKLSGVTTWFRNSFIIRSLITFILYHVIEANPIRNHDVQRCATNLYESDGNSNGGALCLNLAAFKIFADALQNLPSFHRGLLQSSDKIIESCDLHASRDTLHMVTRDRLLLFINSWASNIASSSPSFGLSAENANNLFGVGFYDPAEAALTLSPVLFFSSHEYPSETTFGLVYSVSSSDFMALWDLWKKPTCKECDQAMLLVFTPGRVSAALLFHDQEGMIHMHYVPFALCDSVRGADQSSIAISE
ncbi:hypothetical protein VNO77_19699 [Canavalia gladiata]|uniref:Uncharacterized protein n=1 Tax=Canavalia gladiata TaxID=3824 RepID=A0AAN9LNW8_CANGL